MQTCRDLEWIFHGRALNNILVSSEALSALVLLKEVKEPLGHVVIILQIDQYYPNARACSCLIISWNAVVSCYLQLLYIYFFTSEN